MSKDEKKKDKTEQTVESSAEENAEVKCGSDVTAEEAKTEESAGNAAEEEKDPLKEANEKYEQIRDQHLRLMAEFDNYRKRTTKEKEQSFERGERSAVEAILPAIDNLERALSSGKDPEDPFQKGVQMTYDQIIKSLNQLGVQQLDDLGKTFDPNFHEAMMRAEVEGAAEDEIVAVLRKGYVMNGTLLRASLVKVAQ